MQTRYRVYDLPENEAYSASKEVFADDGVHDIWSLYTLFKLRVVDEVKFLVNLEMDDIT